jgi:hypothetical protein
MHDTFHRIILGHSSIPIGCIDLKVSCGSGENKRWEMLILEVASFDIGYNCIPGKPFLLTFMVVNHTAYATIKMPGRKGVITLKFDQCVALARENIALTHAGRFGEKEAQELATKMAKTVGGRTLTRTVVPKPLASGTPRPLERRRAHSWAPRQTNLPPINRRMT